MCEVNPSGCDSNRGNFITRCIQNHYQTCYQIKSQEQVGKEKWLIGSWFKFSRWYCMPAAFTMQFCSGSFYSWSILNKPIDMLIYNENRNMAPIAFYIAIGFFGVAALLMGPWLERNGPFKSGVAGSTLFFIGNLTTALALHLKLIWMVYIGYGVFAGFGLGICYITPVSTLQKWFPERRGLAAGFAVSGFGAGSIVISKLQLPLINLLGLPLTFVMMGSIYFMVMLTAASVLRTPPSDDLDLDLEDPKAQMTLIEAITSTDFRLLMTMFCACILFGIVLVSRLSNIVTDVFVKTPEEASTIVAINGGFNLAGRLVMSVASDYIGRKNCFFLFMTCQLMILGLFSTMTNSLAYGPFVVSMWVVTMCYGASFGVLPALLSDKFGSRNIGACHGIVISGWCLMGIVGGLVFTTIFNFHVAAGWESTDAYLYNVNVWWIFCVVGIGCVTLIFVLPTELDLMFVQELKNCVKCSLTKSWRVEPKPIVPMVTGGSIKYCGSKIRLGKLGGTLVVPSVTGCRRLSAQAMASYGMV